MLADARTTLPRSDGPGEIKIWGAGRSDKGVKLNMQYASWAPLLDCEAVVTVVAPEQSRVVAACGSDTPGDSAIGRTQDALQSPMFEEHIAATLGKRAFNRDTVSAKEAATVMKNMGGMQREALRRSDEMQQMHAEAEASR